MNGNEQELLEGLRALAADGPREAPAHVEERLLSEFRRRSRARVRSFWLISGTGAIAAGIAALLWIHPAPQSPAPPVLQAGIQETQEMVDETASFYPLRDADELSPLESAMVVRVEMPMSSLRLIGLPVNEELAAERIQADVLLGQDGLARGVRLVQ